MANCQPMAGILWPDGGPGLVVSVAQGHEGRVFVEDMVGPGEALQGFLALDFHLFHPQEILLGGHIVLPTHPGEAETVAQEQGVPMILPTNWVETAGGSSLEVARGRFTTSVGDFEEKRTIAFLAVHRTKKIHLGPEADTALGIARGQVQVDDGSIPRMIRGQGKVEAAADSLVGAHVTEALALRYGSPVEDFESHHFSVRGWAPQEEDENEVREGTHHELRVASERDTFTGTSIRQLGQALWDVISMNRRIIDLVPRLHEQGYSADQQEERRRWLEEKTGASLHGVARHGIDPESMRGNIENPIGAAQIPLGVAGPLEIHGQDAEGIFYVPLATSEGVLIRSYERGMVALTRSGGVVTRVWKDENRMAPVFVFASPADAIRFCEELPDLFEKVRTEAEATTQHGRLLALEALPAGHRAIVRFSFATGDAHGMNMIARATDFACRWLLANTVAERYLLFSGWSGEKRAAGNLLAGGKGKKVTAAATLPRRVVKAVLRVEPADIVDLWSLTVRGHLEAGSMGYNGHCANGLTALFIATGQDVANVVNSALAVTSFEVTPGGDLAANVMIPSLTVATVGGGTGLATAQEGLALLDCVGNGKARKLAEIAAATVLAGELSMAGALAAGEFVSAHETWGRNRPDEQGAVRGMDGGGSE